MSTPPSDPSQPDETTGPSQPDETTEPSQPDETTAQYPASPPAPPPAGELPPPAPPTWELPPAGSQPSQAAPTGAGPSTPPPPPFPPFPPQAPPAAAAPPPAPAVAAVAERRERSLVQRTLPLAIAAILGGAVAGGIVAVADGLRDEPTIVVAQPSAESGTAARQSAPATPAPTDPQTPTAPQGTTPGGETTPDQGEQPVPASTTWLGIEPTPVDGALADRVRLPAESGVMVADVVPDSPADEAGFQKADARITIDGQEYAFGGDIITAIDGEPVRSVDDLRGILSEHQPGDEVQVQVVHADGQPETYEVTLGERPQDESQAQPDDQQGAGPDAQPDDGFGAPDSFQAPDGFPQDG